MRFCLKSMASPLIKLSLLLRKVLKNQMSNTLAQISKAGVAVWLDDLSRDRLKSGSLVKLINEDSVVGVTTNPSILQRLSVNLIFIEVISCKIGIKVLKR